MNSPTLDTCGVRRIQLNNANACSLAEYFGELARASQAEDQALLAAARSGGILPQDLERALSALAAREPGSASSIVISGFPLDQQEVGPTPAHWQGRHAPTGLAFTLWLLGLATRLGEPFSWVYIQDGRLVTDVMPIAGLGHEQTGHGSIAELDMHVEDAFDDNRCAFLVLGCLRNPDGIPTKVASVNDVVLSSEDLEVLFRHQYAFAADTEYARNMTADGRTMPDPPLRPVLFGDRHAPFIRLDLPFMSIESGALSAQAAVSNLVRELTASTKEVILRPGDVLLIDNWRVVHGRRNFTPRYDGTDRWLRRVLVGRPSHRAASDK